MRLPAPGGEDHPRSRGEYESCRICATGPSGSSPLSRGILPSYRDMSVPTGIIPALAGNTRPGLGWWLGRADHPRSRGEYTQARPPEPTQGSDHPRSRGEYLVVDELDELVEGSSPLSRGILYSAVDGRLKERIIPALAGNTPYDESHDPHAEDHPRSRGEYPPPPGLAQISSGSSPLSRGIRELNVTIWTVARIIPALAGNTTRDSLPRISAADHPRSRGEYGFAKGRSGSRRGSSPLSRGIPRSGPSRDRRSGIIPALAGNTGITHGRFHVSSDHPRSRGEYIYTATVHDGPMGSSPLSRGIPGWTGCAMDRDGIIPALAGNTTATLRHHAGTSDHPRSRGEYCIGVYRPRRPCGSSPLSRGIPQEEAWEVLAVRIIPALAGNTSRRGLRRRPGQDHPRSRGEYTC